MPFPRWVAKLNKRVTNRLLIRLSRRPPFGALTHRGRVSHASYRIPLNAFPTEDGFVFALTYGSEADWVQNVLAAGDCQLEFGGDALTLSEPRLVGRDEAVGYLPRAWRMAVLALRVTEFLSMRTRASEHLAGG